MTDNQKMMQDIELITNELRDHNFISMERMRQLAKMLVESDKFYYFHRVKDACMKRLFDFIMSQTSFIDYDASINTRFWYVIHNKTELMRCHNPTCGKVIRRKSMNPLDDNDIWYCCDKCVSEDPCYREKISFSMRGKTIDSDKSTRKNLPPERRIEYKDELIVYDDMMNAQLATFYEEHKKSFKFWIDKNVDLKKYLFEKSYPIDFTDLNIGTRVFWVFNKMQVFPRCRTCGRQLDFINVKLSKGFQEYCCIECANEGHSINAHKKNRINVYRNKILISPIVEPLFSEEFFVENCTPRVANDTLYNCKCKICGLEFKTKYDENFYAREAQHKSFFRCPHCFPILASHKSKLEKNMLKFIEDIVGNKYKVISGDRVKIKPYEFDVLIPDINIAFEFNGVYWHSYEHSADCGDAQMIKMRKAEDANIKLMVIWEDMWMHDNENTCNLIRDFIQDDHLIEKKYDFVNNDIVEVDRSLFNRCCSVNGFEIIDEVQQGVVLRSHPKYEDIKFKTPDYGKLVFQRIQNCSE